MFKLLRGLFYSNKELKVDKTWVCNPPRASKHYYPIGHINENYMSILKERYEKAQEEIKSGRLSLEKQRN